MALKSLGTLFTTPSYTHTLFIIMISHGSEFEIWICTHIHYKTIALHEQAAVQQPRDASLQKGQCSDNAHQTME